jgi:hypothetical protein
VLKLDVLCVACKILAGKMEMNRPLGSCTVDAGERRG